jgi:hypothetical protein
MTVRPQALLILVAVFLAFAFVAADAPPSDAAFPGYNGSLAFTSTRDGNDEIYRIAPNGGTLQRLTDHDLTDDGAVWSPDGTKKSPSPATSAPLRTPSGS